MNHCAWCRKSFIPDMFKMNPVVIEIFEGEKFIVHEHCLDDINADLAKKKSKKAREAITLSVLKALSNGGGAK